MRHIKHQRQIQAFLIEEFDESKGAALFRLQEETLDALLKSEKTYPKARWKHYLRWFCRASRCTRLWSLLPKRTPMHSHEKYMLSRCEEPCLHRKNGSSTWILFTVIYSLGSCAHPTYGKVIRPITTIPLTLRFMRASGIQPVFRMAVPSFLRRWQLDIWQPEKNRLYPYSNPGI